MLLLEHYVDFDDINNPVKYKMNNRNGYYADYDSLKYVNIFLQPNTANFQDSAIHFNDKVTKKFWSLGDSIESTQPKDNEVLKLYMLLDSANGHYSRVGYSLLDVIANIGGFYGILSLLVSYIVGLFDQNSLLFELMRSLYYMKMDSPHFSSNNNPAQIFN